MDVENASTRKGLRLGAVLTMIGFVWMGQGAYLIGGSLMTGQRTWLLVGGIVAVIGLVLIASTRARSD